MTGVTVLGQHLLAAPKPYTPDPPMTEHALGYVPACGACGGIETRANFAGKFCCDCGARI